MHTKQHKHPRFRKQSIIADWDINTLQDNKKEKRVWNVKRVRFRLNKLKTLLILLRLLDQNIGFANVKIKK